MSFLILAETSAGYALFKAKDKKLLKKDDLAQEISTAEGASGLSVFFFFFFFLN
jgi:nucleolar protein 58